MDLEKLIRHPSVYNLIQSVNGEKIFRRVLVDKYIRPKNGDRILDIGCGTGGYVAYLRQVSVEYYGFDESREYINYAKKKYAHDANFHFNCDRLEQANIDKLPKFDIVMAMGVQHHLNDEQVLRLLTLARAALKPTGRLVTMDPCLSNDMNLLEWLTVKYDRGRFIRTQKEFERLIDQVFLVRRSVVDILGKFPERAFLSECRIQNGISSFGGQ